VAHVKPHWTPSHVAVPCAGVAHGAQLMVPQLATLAFG
jgi:hypothetical protein